MTGRSLGLPVEKKSPRFQLRDKLVRAQCVSLSQDHFAQRMSFREVREDEVLEGPNRDEVTAHPPSRGLQPARSQPREDSFAEARRGVKPAPRARQTILRGRGREPGTGSGARGCA